MARTFVGEYLVAVEFSRPHSYRDDPMCQRKECGGLDVGDDNADRRDSDHHEPETREHPPPFTAHSVGMAMPCKPESVGRGNCDTKTCENSEGDMYPDHGHENSSASWDIDGVVMLS